MIRSKEDFLRYLEADRMALGRRHRYGIKDWFLDEIWTFERLLRKVEYLTNCQPYILNGVIRRLTYWRLHRLAVRLSFSIPINVCDEGLSIAHYGSIVVSEKAHIGKNCRIHVGVNVGVGGPDGKAPTIGDDCYLGPGAKLWGGIVIGNRTQIGANAVVTKSFEDGNCTVVGVPARRVK